MPYIHVIIDSCITNLVVIFVCLLYFCTSVPDKTILGVGHTPQNQDVMREVKRHFDQDLLLTKQAYEERVQVGWLVGLRVELYC